MTIKSFARSVRLHILKRCGITTGRILLKPARVDHGPAIGITTRARQWIS
jgi:hypothetical protein